jgi:hypothetical protein
VDGDDGVGVTPLEEQRYVEAARTATDDQYAHGASQTRIVRRKALYIK